MKNLNSKGFTLPEILIACAMMAMLGLFSASVISDFMKISKIVQNETTSQTDVSLATLYLTKVFRSAKPSFNTLVGTPDDNGKEFYDFYSDVPSDKWPAESDKTRTLTLSGTSGKLELYVFTEDPKQKTAISYDPRAAYADAQPVVDMEASAVLTYTGLNYMNLLSTRYPDIWVNQQIFLLRVPIPLRYVAADGTVSMEPGSVPRELSYVGAVSGNTLTTSGFDANLLSRLWNKQPVDGTVVDSPDTLLRKIPSVGGSAPLVILEAIKVVKLSLELNAKNVYNLYMSEYKGGSFTNKNLISPNVKSFVVSRDSVSRSILRYKLTLNGVSQ